MLAPLEKLFPFLLRKAINNGLRKRQEIVRVVLKTQEIQTLMRTSESIIKSICISGRTHTTSYTTPTRAVLDFYYLHALSRLLFNNICFIHSQTKRFHFRFCLIHLNECMCISSPSSSSELVFLLAGKARIECAKRISLLQSASFSVLLFSSRKSP